MHAVYFAGCGVYFSCMRCILQACGVKAPCTHKRALSRPSAVLRYRLHLVVLLSKKSKNNDDVYNSTTTTARILSEERFSPMHFRRQPPLIPQYRPLLYAVPS
jgi:hypothetical protein